MKKLLLLSLLPLYLHVMAQPGNGGHRFPALGDLIITEIMADPTPSHGLPEKKWLEIVNHSPDTLKLKGVLLIADKDTAFLPDELIAPGEYMVLCATGSRADLLPYGRVVAVKSFPTITIAGKLIALRTPGGRLIHAVNYSPLFLGDGLRSGGGWSAELTDLDNPFHEPYAWAPSEDPSGGTPGRANSANRSVPDIRPPRLLACWPVTPSLVALLFDETVISDGAGPWLADGIAAGPASSGDHGDRMLLVPLRDEIMPGRIISLQIPEGVTDFAGNRPGAGVVRTGLPADPAPGEILFNELMPQPPDGCSEYAELYNNSAKVFDLAELYLASGTSAAATAFTTLHRQLLPGGYVALTTGRSETFAECYTCADEGNVLYADRLPVLNDKRGTLILYDRHMRVIDRVDYSSDMHMMFLSGSRGVALEKVSPAFASDVAANWHSATEACNWATPGAHNSVMVVTGGEERGMTLSSGRLSPDGDGFEDLLTVGVFPGGDENIITVTVFNERGYPVRRLAVRASAGAGTWYTWDGTDDTGSLLPAGLYMIMAESYNTAGATGRWKKVCALLYR